MKMKYFSWGKKLCVIASPNVCAGGVWKSLMAQPNIHNEEKIFITKVRNNNFLLREPEPKISVILLSIISVRTAKRNRKAFPHEASLKMEINCEGLAKWLGG